MPAAQNTNEFLLQISYSAPLITRPRSFHLRELGRILYLRKVRNYTLFHLIETRTRHVREKKNAFVETKRQ